MVACFARVACLSLILACSLADSPVRAQEPQGTWQDAVRLVDSTSLADIAAAISKLEPLTSPDRTIAPPAGALVALALCQLRQADYDAAQATIKRINAQVTPTQLLPRRGALLRMSLIVALAREDAPAADAAFKDLVRMISAGQGDSIEQKLNASVIGTVVAMLSVDRANSPISPRVLQIGNEQLQNSKLRGVAAHYQAAFENNNERTEALVANFLRIEKDGIDAIAAELAQRQEALKQRAAELKDQKELTGEVIRNTREQTDQNTQDARKLASEINRINLKLRQPTPGHPGPKQQPPPPLPPLFSIPVEEYETQNDYDYVTQNGQTVRVPVTRTVRRSQAEIDRDRNLIYRRMRDEHNRLVADYKGYETQYNNLLASWQNEDLRRRKELNQEKAELEVKRDELLAANKAIKDDKVDSTKDLRIKRTETEQEQFEVELLEIAVQTYRDGQPHKAFRPQHFESLNWTQEKILLQKP